MNKAYSMDPNDAGILMYTATFYANYLVRPSKADSDIK